MNESTRQRYMQGLGVRLWYAGYKLPGAAPSPQFEFDAVATPTQESTEPRDKARPLAVAKLMQVSAVAPVSREVELPVVVRPQDVPPPMSPPVGKQSPPANDAAVVFDSPAAESVAPFQVQVFTACGFLWLCAANPETDDKRDAALLRNIVAAVWPQQQPAPELHFGWPVFAHPDVTGQDRLVASRVWNGVLRQRLQAVRGLITLGSLPLWEQPANGSIAGYRALDVEYQGEDKPVLMLCGLGEMLLDPQRKKEVWRSLKTFIDSYQA